MTETTPSADSRRVPPPKIPAASPAPSPWWKVGAGIAVVSGQVAAAYVHPAIEAALAVADASIPLVAGTVLIAVIVFGSDDACERIFRLLRWIANRPEPPAPPDRVPSGGRAGSPRRSTSR
jgi:hypothetical protein